MRVLLLAAAAAAVAACQTPSAPEIPLTPMEGRIQATLERAAAQQQAMDSPAPPAPAAPAN